MHSTVSDGVVSPTALAARVRTVGLAVAALTDHDSTDGVVAFREAAVGVRVIPGIELTCRVRQGDHGTVHVLGYGVDLEAPDLQRVARFNRMAKRAQIEAILADLPRTAGVTLTWDDVAEGRGDDAYVGRNQIARVLVERGVVKDRAKAFRRFLRNKHVPDVQVVQATEGVAAIRAAGGVAVLAHPTDHDLDRHLKSLIDVGVTGLEVYRPRAIGRRLERVLGVAERRGLWITGGSDWHGHAKDSHLGAWRAPPDALRPFLEALEDGRAVLGGPTPTNH